MLRETNSYMLMFKSEGKIKDSFSKAKARVYPRTLTKTIRVVLHEEPRKKEWKEKEMMTVYLNPALAI